MNLPTRQHSSSSRERERSYISSRVGVRYLISCIRKNGICSTLSSANWRYDNTFSAPDISTNRPSTESTTFRMKTGVVTIMRIAIPTPTAMAAWR